MRTINPMIQAFFGPHTKHVSALAAVSPTFADEVMTHPTYRAICDERAVAVVLARTGSTSVT